MTGVWVLLGVLVLCTAFGLVHRSRSGRLRAEPPTSRRAPQARAPQTPAQAEATQPHAVEEGPGLHDVLASLGETPGDRATLLQFSSAFCAPCRATRRILTDVAELVPGVRHVEVDAEKHLDVVRRLGIRTTPTTLVLDADARVTARAAGQPRRAEVLAALGNAVP